MRGQPSEGRERFAAVLSRSPEQTTARARALHAAGGLAFLQGDHTAARALTEEGLAIFRRLEDGPGIAMSLLSLGRLVGHRDAAVARSFYEESLAIEQGLGNTAGVAQSLFYLGIITWCHGQPAPPLLEECLALFQSLGDKRGIMSSLGILGSVAWTQGDYGQATELHQQSLALARELGDKGWIASAVINLGQIAWFQGDYQRATALHTESLALAREAELATSIAWSLRNLGSDAWAQGDYARAMELHQQSLPLYWSTEDIWGTVECIEGLAWAACSQGQTTGEAEPFARASQLLGAAAASRKCTGNPMAPAYRAANDRAIAETRAYMGEAAFAAAWDEGRALSLEQAIAEAQTLIRKPAAPVRKPALLDAATTLIADAQWDRITPLLSPAPKQQTGRPRMHDRQAMTAIFYALETGCGWKALPRTLGASSTIHDRFRAWRAAGVFERLWRAGLLTDAIAHKLALTEQEQEI